MIQSLKLLSIFILLLLVTFSCGEKEKEQENVVPIAKKKNPAANTRIDYDSAVLRVPPEQMKTVHTNAFRLRPDRRFLQAIPEIHSFLTGEKKELPQVVFDGSKWSIRYKKELVGSVPELPNYSDSSAVLLDWTKRLSKKHPIRWSGNIPESETKSIQKHMNQFLSPAPVAALREIDRLWNNGTRTPELLHFASQALTYLTFQSFDQMEIGDPLPARALAILFITKAVTSLDTAGEECLLSLALSYSRSARELASSLKDGDPIRLFVLHHDALLANAARQKGSLPMVRYLYVYRVATQMDGDAFFQTANENFGDQNSLPLLKAGLIIGEAGQREATGTEHLINDIPALVVTELEQMQPQMQAPTRPKEPEAKDPLAKIFASFEPAVEKASMGLHGPFLDRSILESFYGGYIVTAGGQLRKSVSGPEMSVFREYKTFAGHVLSYRRSNYRLYKEDYEKLSLLGGSCFYWGYIEAIESLDADSPMISMLAEILAPRLDTRPSNRWNLAFIAKNNLMDSKLANQLFSSIVEDCYFDNPVYLSYSAAFSLTEEKINSFMRSPECEMNCQDYTISYYSSSPNANPQFVEQEFDKLFKQYPTKWVIINTYIDYLRKVKKYDKLCSVVEQWINRNNDPSHIGYYHSHIRQAYNYYFAGRYEKGLETLKPIQGSLFAQRQAALIYNKLGRKKEAEDNARSCVKQTAKDLETRMTLVQILWENGKYSEASDVLNSAPTPITQNEWCSEVAPPFERAFGKLAEEEALKALTSLQQKHVTRWNLTCLAKPFADSENFGLAFQIQSRVQPVGIADMEVMIDSYRYLKGWKGQESAVQWIRKLIPPNQLSPLAEKAFYSNQFEVLWDVIEDPSVSEHPEEVWLLRAAASRMIGQEKDKHRKELDDHYGKNSSDANRIMGRYLIGLSSEKELMKAATTPETRCTASFCLAIMAQSQGNILDASDWYRIAIETGRSSDSSYRISQRVLRKWKSTTRALQFLPASQFSEL